MSKLNFFISLSLVDFFRVWINWHSQSVSYLELTSILNYPLSRTTLHLKLPSISNTLYLELLSISNYSLSQATLYLKLPYISNCPLSQTTFYLELPTIAKYPLLTWFSVTRPLAKLYSEKWCVLFHHSFFFWFTTGWQESVWISLHWIHGSWHAPHNQVRWHFHVPCQQIIPSRKGKTTLFYFNWKLWLFFNQLINQSINV